MRVLVVTLTLVGCGFSGPKTGGAPGDAASHDGAVLIDSGQLFDGPPIGGLAVPHVPAPNALPGAGPFMLTGAIDTTAMTIGEPIANGATFEHVPQPGGGPELAILHAGDLVIPALANVTVTGSRALVIIAYTITISGTLDGSARRGTPGPGGNTAMGAGGDGGHKMDSSDGGGGGGGYNGKGAPGGTSCGGGPASTAMGGMGGMVMLMDTLAVLEGGAAGGAGGIGDCTVASTGGGGGGAIQLTAYTSISIMANGVVDVGGAGGSGGTACMFDGSSGGGGGTGGAIVLNTPALTISGIVVANGGGGGGGGCAGVTTPGAAGASGLRATDAASGGMGTDCGSDGGDGGSLAAPTAGGDVDCESNGGGGGGAAGRIGFFIPKANRQISTSGVISPTSKTIDSP